ncbi:hypothetical protein PR048_008524 [Dryococelus australis]|uniref:Uncharacterized protein n=1 Tax=Dryococelus australis TaxID=614101 RepID=A0ABQ9HY99_9NEOP|nr:hypothetical protein PR048_008524 [Dryococelus australis]
MYSSEQAPAYLATVRHTSLRLCGGVVVRLLASHLGEPRSIPGGDFHMWESFRMMLLVGGSSRDLPFPPPMHYGDSPSLPHSTIFSSEDLDVKSHADLYIPSYCFHQSIAKFQEQFEVFYFGLLVVEAFHFFMAGVCVGFVRTFTRDVMRSSHTGQSCASQWSFKLACITSGQMLPTEPLTWASDPVSFVKVAKALQFGWGVGVEYRERHNEDAIFKYQYRKKLRQLCKGNCKPRGKTSSLHSRQRKERRRECESCMRRKELQHLLPHAYRISRWLIVGLETLEIRTLLPLFMQGGILRTLIKNYKDSPFESQQVMSIPPAASMGTNSSDDYDETVYANDGMRDLRVNELQNKQLSALNTDEDYMTPTKTSKLGIEDEIGGEGDHEVSIGDNDCDASVDEVSDEKNNSLDVPIHFTNTYPSTSGLKKVEGVKNLGNGEQMRGIASLHGVAKSTVGRSVSRVVDAIVDRLFQYTLSLIFPQLRSLYDYDGSMTLSWRSTYAGGVRGDWRTFWESAIISQQYHATAVFRDADFRQRKKYHRCRKPGELDSRNSSSEWIHKSGSQRYKLGPIA